MDFHFVRNLAILALGQVMATVAGVLSAGVCFKWYTMVGVRPPDGTTWVSEYGFVALVVPLTWITTTMSLFTRRNWAEEELVPWAWKIGVLELMLLLMGALYTSVLPWLKLFCGCGGLSE